MSFWDTFIKVWQVRASMRIQDGIESATRQARHEKETSENLPKIIQELQEKNALWNREMEYQRGIKNEGDEV